MRDAMTRWPWYAPVFAAYPLLYIAASNPGQVEGLMVMAFAAAAVIAAVLLVALLRPILGSWATAGLGAAWVLLLFYAYGPVNEWWLDFVRVGIEQRSTELSWYNANPQLVHSVVWALLVLAGIDRLRRARPWTAAGLTSGLNFMALLLASFLLIQSIVNVARGGHSGAQVPEGQATLAAKTPEAPGPDIYFIVLDGYARADILSEYYAFDNGPFIDGLRQQGFQVSDASRSNFAWTFLSLGSALNLDYIQPLLGEALDPEGRDREETYRLLRDNRAARFLRERGYRSVHLQSTWGGTGSNPFADEFLPCHTGLFGNEFLRAIADASWLRALESKASMDIASCHLQNFGKLAAQAKAPGPKFVFAHFVPPHHPYLFDRDGNVLRRANISDQFEFQKRLWEDRQSYVDQLVYMNRRIGEVAARLIADSPRPPVILLVSDHGPNLRDGLPQSAQRRIRLANLTAMYLPGAPAGLVPAAATPVNHLRRVFNFYFDAGLPLLPDRYFISSYTRPFELLEVGANDELLPTPGGF
jgi:hypothetical protein